MFKYGLSINPTSKRIISFNCNNNTTPKCIVKYLTYPSCCRDVTPSPPNPPSPTIDYSFLEDYYWIVPPETLEAYIYNYSGQQKIIDQTVWIFNSTDNNYIFGDCYTSLNIPNETIIYSSFKLVGSITNDTDRVQINFTNSNNVTTVGSGNLSYYKNAPKKSYFTMQMNKKDVIHWSYMIPITSSDPYYYNLPGTGETMDEFLANF